MPSSKNKQKKIITVLGGAGFLGSHVCDALSSAGYQVRIFDLKPSPFLRSDQTMFQGDLMDRESIVKAAQGSEVLFNFAGIADIDEAYNRPFETCRLNVLGNLNALEAAHEIGAKRFVFASSVYVYSQSGSFYRASKQASEAFIEAYQERYGIDYTILRYGSLYGPRGDQRNGIYRLLYQALHHQKITYGGTGNELREYIHVYDAAKASVRILAPEFANQHVILTGNEKLTVCQMMEMIREMLAPFQPITLQFNSNPVAGHYTITPYTFHPKMGTKFLVNPHIDLGQGILDLIRELHQSLHPEFHSEGDLLVKNGNEIPPQKKKKISHKRKSS
ncbi:MAG: NAD(P)-dependent oxidoreductase [Planctomycetota bacterium]